MAERNTKLRGLKLSNDEANRITRESIETALIQLLAERDIHDITIEELVRRAGVSRMAYYRNYGSMDAILSNIADRVCENISAAMDAYLKLGDWAGARRALFHVIYKHQDFCQLLISAHEGERLQTFFNDFAAKYVYNGSDQERYRMYFWAGAVFNLTVEWINEGMAISPDVLADYCNAASLPRESDSV